MLNMEIGNTERILLHELENLFLKPLDTDGFERFHAYFFEGSVPVHPDFKTLGKLIGEIVDSRCQCGVEETEEEMLRLLSIVKS